MAVYAMGDLHGRLDLYKKVKEFIKPDDTVICVGDCGDRGPQPWETIKAVLNDEQFVYLMGNHDHMLMKAMHQFCGEDPTYYFNPLNACVENGGSMTLSGWMREGADLAWARRLSGLKARAYYENENGNSICVCHGGFTPKVSPNEQRPLADIIWDRDHLKDKWPDSKELENVIIVFGHTPTGLINKKCGDKALWFAGAHKVDIDCGAVWTGKLCLLDLDTLEEHYIIGEPMEDI